MLIDPAAVVAQLCARSLSGATLVPEGAAGTGRSPAIIRGQGMTTNASSCMPRKMPRSQRIEFSSYLYRREAKFILDSTGDIERRRCCHCAPSALKPLFVATHSPRCRSLICRQECATKPPVIRAGASSGKPVSRTLRSPSNRGPGTAGASLLHAQAWKIQANNHRLRDRSVRPGDFNLAYEQARCRNALSCKEGVASYRQERLVRRQ